MVIRGVADRSNTHNKRSWTSNIATACTARDTRHGSRSFSPAIIRRFCRPRTEPRRPGKVVPGRLNGYAISALPDSGASINAMHHDFAVERGLAILPIMHKATINIQNAIGSPIIPTGFPHKTHRVEFFTFKDSPPVVLGNAFLNLPDLLFRFSTRLVDDLSSLPAGNDSNTLKVHLMHMNTSDLPHFRGSLDGVPMQALADSGCEPNIVSLAYAKASGMSIDFTQSASLELAGGMTVTSIGTCYAMWYFNDESQWVYNTGRCLAFHVLEGCSFDVMLGKDVVFGEGKLRIHHGQQQLPALRSESADAPSTRCFNLIREPSWNSVVNRLKRWLGRGNRTSGNSTGVVSTVDEQNEELVRRLQARHDNDQKPHGQNKADAERIERLAQEDWNARAQALLALSNPVAPAPQSTTPSLSNPPLSNPNSSI
ncbi:hypothetical protein KVT40_007970 [Elsinoe batatas]|uniref:Peptidase A2 domain-containing protein n=1 Tax=Elsinoe batatas TaxID=2601811 RepID=A0A8K0PEX3_9PEZI|nr:hypothetical protein KVT40_007970 [Elsinoe batatas]